MQFSLKTLLVLTTLLTVTVASLMYPVPLLASFFYTAAAGSVLLSIVAALLHKADRRASSIGYLVVAGGYFWLTLLPNPRTGFLSSSGMTRISSPNNIDMSLATTCILCTTYQLTGGQYAPKSGNLQAMQAWQAMLRELANGSLNSYLLFPNVMSFLIIGHSAFAILFGWLGGMFGQSLVRRATQAAN